MISIIVAIDQQDAIGYSNQLLCHLPNDLKRFKQLTTGKTVVMGRKTWDSLPVKPLPNRKNVVLSKDIKDNITICYYDKTLLFQDIDDVFLYIRGIESIDTQEEIFIIGGRQIYELFLPHANKLYLTQIYHKFENVDTYFPLDKNELILDWKCIEFLENQKDEKHLYDYAFKTFVRR